jgi:DNA-binding CsgD family transcriptional regulator
MAESSRIVDQSSSVSMRRVVVKMGSVRVDLHRKERQYEETFPMHSPEGVEVFLENLQYVKSRRLKGDLDASLLILDFDLTLSEAPLSRREREILYWRYEREYTEKETAKMLGITHKAVKEYKRRAIYKIADTNAVKEGYINAKHND